MEMLSRGAKLHLDSQLFSVILSWHFFFFNKNKKMLRKLTVTVFFLQYFAKIQLRMLFLHLFLGGFFQTAFQL